MLAVRQAHVLHLKLAAGRHTRRCLTTARRLQSTALRHTRLDRSGWVAGRSQVQSCLLPSERVLAQRLQQLGIEQPVGETRDLRAGIDEHAGDEQPRRSTPADDAAFGRVVRVLAAADAESLARVEPAARGTRPRAVGLPVDFGKALEMSACPASRSRTVSSCAVRAPVAFHEGELSRGPRSQPNWCLTRPTFEISADCLKGRVLGSLARTGLCLSPEHTKAPLTRGFCRFGSRPDQRGISPPVAPRRATRRSRCRGSRPAP